MRACAERHDISLYNVVKTSAGMYPERSAYEFLGKERSFRELLTLIDSIAASFSSLGISNGQRVALCLPNCPHLVAAIYALNSIGAVAVLVNPLLNGEDILDFVDRTESRAVIVLDLLIKKYEKAFQKRANQHTLICVSLAGDISLKNKAKIYTAGLTKLVQAFFLKHRLKAMSWENFLKMGRGNTPIHVEDPHADAVIFLSGGTTHHPKGIVHSSVSLNTAAFYSLATEPPIDEKDTMIAVLPGFHIFGFTVSIHITLACGGRCCLVPRFHPDTVARLIIKMKPTYMAGVPTLYEGILRSKTLIKASSKGKVDMSRFRIGFSGGDGLPESTREGFNQFIRKNGGKGRIAEGYGLTECCPITVMPAEDLVEGSVGKPFEGVRICIMDPEDGRDLPVDEVGEICIASEAVMKYYFLDPDASRKALRKHHDGLVWLHTGDMGRLGPTGHLFFSHRKERHVKVSGYTVSLNKVEETVADCLFISKAAAIALPDDYRIHRIKLFAVLEGAPPNQQTKRQLMSFCRQKLPPWAIPSEIEFCSFLPVNQLGKTAWSQLEKEETIKKKTVQV